MVGFTKAAMRARRASRNAIKALRLDPYYLGDEAAEYGMPEKTNPFADGTEEHADWLKGYRDAEFERSKRSGT